MEASKKNNLASLGMAKMAPQAIEFEKVVLGAIMLENEAMQEVISVIKNPECFYSDAHQRIYAAMLNLYNKAAGINFMTVGEELRKSSELETVGGAYYVTNLCEHVIGGERIQENARVVVDKYILREVIRISGAAISDAYQAGTDPFELLSKISSNLTTIEDVRTGDGMLHSSLAAEEALEEMEERSKSDSDLIGDSYGIHSLDAITKGNYAPQVTTLAADTGVGKTTAALNFAQEWALNGIATAYFSLEMSPKQLIYKTFSAEIERPIHYVKQGRLTDEEKEKLLGFLHILKTKNLYFNSRTGIDVIEFRSICRGLVRKHGVKKVIIDYLQLMGAGSNFKGNREAELSYISRQIKECALELNISIVQLSQVTIEKGACRTHFERDLRGSTAIGQHSDNIIFTLRPKRQGMESLQIGGMGVEWSDKDALFQVAKAREGETGIVEVDFHAIAQKFTDKKSAFDDYPSPPKSKVPENKNLSTDSMVQGSKDEHPF